MTPFINGETIYLRALGSGDVNSTYLSWLNDVETTKDLLAGRYPSTLQQLDDYVQRATSDPGTVMFAICSRKDNTHIGNIKLDHFDAVDGTCELGLLLGNKDYWGKGIGEEVCRLTLQYAFNTLNIRKVLLAVYSNNPAAIRLYEKLGFVHEGKLRQHLFCQGEYIDKLYMGLFKNELV